MSPSTAPGIRVPLAAAVTGALALHAGHKLELGLLGEMLWACHVASLLIAIGIFFRKLTLVAVGTLFHAAVGLPAYVLDVITLGQTTATSVLVHVLPPLAGLFSLKYQTPWPRFVPAATAALYVALIPVSRLLTEPALNVNLAFAPWPPLVRVAPWPWVTWLANTAWILAVTPLVDRALRRVLHGAAWTGAAHG
jgi:hypothetical protein